MNKGILIDAKNRRIVDVEVGDFRDIQAKIGCSMFTTAGVLPNGDSVFVDDEGLINGTEEFFYNPDIYPHPLAGNAVILGCDEMGESVDVKSRILGIAMKTDFLNRSDFIVP
jgi:hypothetical protein